MCNRQLDLNFGRSANALRPLLFHLHDAIVRQSLPEFPGLPHSRMMMRLRRHDRLSKYASTAHRIRNVIASQLDGTTSGPDVL
jgi:hypothetical protein